MTTTWLSPPTINGPLECELVWQKEQVQVNNNPKASNRSSEFGMQDSAGEFNPNRLLKNSDWVRFWEGHDFSRALKSFNTNRALAPASCFRHQQRVFQQPC
jgi:hypothetical protein